MRLYSLEWVLKVLEELGGEASVELLRRMSAGLVPSKYYVADCYFPDVGEEGLSCVEEALRELERMGAIEVDGGKVRLAHVKGALRGQHGLL
ncbi:MAG: hypothetical protein GXO07_01120 [Crenarchaeota archaeon]|nr:hypothetical protein [Thermoproteota archaeon]